MTSKNKNAASAAQSTTDPIQVDMNYAGSDDMQEFSLLGGLSTTAGGTYASADFQDAEENRPAGASLESLGGNQDSIQGIVQQTMHRHLTDATPPQTSPSLTSFNTQTNNWRRRLREMMVRQNETVLGFLHLPSTDHSTIGPVERALRRYAIRQDIDTSQIRSLKQVLTDVSGHQVIVEEIEARLQSKGPSSLTQIKEQVNTLIDLYKETGEKLLECENQLKMRLEKMDKLQRRVATMMDLQTNEAMPNLLKATEEYLKIAFHDMGIEQQYKNLLFYYKKHTALREAIQIFKTGHLATQEPTCSICLTDSICMAIVPCGHTFCLNCCRRMMECGICRTRIREKMKLFIS